MKRVYYRYFTYTWQEQKDLLSFVSMEVASLGEPLLKSVKDLSLGGLLSLMSYVMVFICLFCQGSRFQ